MKKVLVIFILAVVAISGAFAQIEELSVGGGFFINSDLGGSGYTITAPGAGSLEFDSTHKGFGIFSFIDIFYAEISLGVLWGTLTDKITAPGEIEITNWDLTSIHFSILGKYPIDMIDFVVFPAIGIEYQSYSEVSYFGYPLNNPGQWSSLWIRFGGGIDYDINPDIFIRGTLLYGIKLPSDGEKVEFANAQSWASSNGLVANQNRAHGIQIKAAIGYRIW